MAAAHPYFPVDLQLPEYAPMAVGFEYILGVFVAAVAAALAATWALSGARCCCCCCCCCLRRACDLGARCQHALARAPGPLLPRAAGTYKHLTTTERVVASWLVTTGLIHFVIEGYVVARASFYTDASGNYLSDACESSFVPAAPQRRWRVWVGGGTRSPPAQAPASHLTLHAIMQGRSMPRPTRATSRVTHS